MTILAVAALILLGIILIIIEFLVLPGISIAGIGGFVLMVTGIVIAYKNFGNTTGHLIVFGSIIILIITIFTSLKSKTWKKFALESKIDSKVESEQSFKKIQVGDTGTTISRLAPMGTVQINNEFMEGKSLDTFIDQNTEIIVIQVLNNKVIVKPKNS
jgi:membrane-bound ClpP family serine protease